MKTCSRRRRKGVPTPNLCFLSSSLAVVVATLLLIIPTKQVQSFRGIPGNIASDYGYDNGGTDQVCWLVQSSTSPYSTVISNLLGNENEENERQQLLLINNPLYNNFTAVLPDAIELYPICPIGTSLDVYVPFTSVDSSGGGTAAPSVAVTQQNYTFVVNGTLDLRSWPTDLVVSSNNDADGGNNNRISLEAVVHIVLCELQTTGFCSPFVHYQSNTTTTPEVFGDVHDGTHVDSDYVIVPIVPDESFNFSVEVPVRVNTPGLYSVVAGLLFFLSDIDTFPDALYVASVAAIPDNTTFQILEFRNEPTILTTSRTAEIVSYVVIGLGGTTLLFLMGQLIQNRTNQVVTLTQGKFLVLMLFVGMVAMVGSVFFNPKNDLYCNMLGPLLVVPIHIFYSIILGRLWRINAVISPLLLLTLDKEETFTTKCVHFLSRATTCNKKNQQQHTLRRKVTDAQLARVILLWASPQILLQILNWTLTPDEAQVVFNEDLTTGSMVCSGMYNHHVADVLSVVLLVVQFIALWIVARQSQDLPSLFNEATVIFDVTLVSVIILAVATIVIIMTSGPSTSPSVMYIIGVLGTQAMILNASLKLVLPKLQMVWRNETVVVTKLISDHQREQRQRKKSSVIIYDENDLPLDPRQHMTSAAVDDDDSSEGSSVVLVQTTVEDSIDDAQDEQEAAVPSTVSLEPIAEALDSLNSIAFDLSGVGRDEALPQSAPNSGEFVTHVSTAAVSTRPRLEAAPHSFHTFSRSRRTIVTGVETLAARRRLFSKDSAEEPSLSRKNLLTNQGGFRSARNGMFAAIGSVRNLGITDIAKGKQQQVESYEIDYHPDVEEKIKISESETPSRRLLLRMIDVQQLLKKVNQTLLAGMPVTREEWDLIREATIELGGVFEEDVEFDWEEAKVALQDAPSAERRRSSDTASTKRQRRLIVEKRK